MLIVAAGDKNQLMTYVEVQYTVILKFHLSLATMLLITLEFLEFSLEVFSNTAIRETKTGNKEPGTRLFFS